MIIIDAFCLFRFFIVYCFIQLSLLKMHSLSVCKMAFLLIVFIVFSHSEPNNIFCFNKTDNSSNELDFVWVEILMKMCKMTWCVFSTHILLIGNMRMERIYFMDDLFSWPSSIIRMKIHRGYFIYYSMKMNLFVGFHLRKMNSIPHHPFSRQWIQVLKLCCSEF